jgi:trans-aconitate methyltransferase
LFFKAIERCGSPGLGQELHAIDLGYGDGTETLHLLQQGWSVLAIDAEQSACDLLLTRTPKDLLPRLKMKISCFEEVDLPPADLVYAGFSLPFCRPQHFPMIWEKITASLKPSGRFAGDFFGIKDSWSKREDMTFLTQAHIERMFLDLEVELIEERDEDGQAASGPKHWHVFSVIAKKRG